MWAAFLSRIWYPFFLTYFEGAEYGYDGYQVDFFLLKNANQNGRHKNGIIKMLMIVKLQTWN